VGVSYDNRQEVIKRTAAGEPLLVVREPTNPVDRNAVAVLTIRGEQLGYVKKVPPAPTSPVSPPSEKPRLSFRPGCVAQHARIAW
jgi:hypothetical protein